MSDYSLDITRILSPAPAGVRTFGIEIELETVPGQLALAKRIRTNEKLANKWLCKYDGSLSSYGIEVISIPQTYSDLRESIGELFDLAEITKNVRKSSNCGTHIHVGRDGVDSRTIGRLWAIFHRSQYNEKMKNLLKSLFGRGNIHWASWNCEPPIVLKPRHVWIEGKKYKIGLSNTGAPIFNDHYSAVSCSSHHKTYEIRAFGGVTRKLTALRYLDTLDMLLSICSETHGIKVLTDHIVLLGEIGKRLAQYPALEEAFRNPEKTLGMNYFSIVDQVKVGKKERARPNLNGRDIPVRDTKQNITSALVKLKAAEIMFKPPELKKKESTKSSVDGFVNANSIGR